MEEYQKDLDIQLADARKRAEQGIAAKDFHKRAEGKLIQDWVNESISRELEHMTAKSPLSYEDYLEKHGAVRVLKDFNVMLNSKARQANSAAQEVNVLNEQQQAAISAQRPIKF